MPIGVIESLDHEARGITRLDGKTIFVDGALPGEIVEYASFRKKPSYELAHLVAVVSGSVARVRPRCEHFGVCGGCAMQHLEPSAQVAAKQRILEVYLNSAAWDEGAFGAEAAAQHHFGVSAARLSRQQASYLAAVLPNPRNWSAGRPSPYVSRRASWIQRQMRQLGGDSYLDTLNTSRKAPWAE